MAVVSRIETQDAQQTSIYLLILSVMIDMIFHLSAKQDYHISTVVYSFLKWPIFRKMSVCHRAHPGENRLRGARLSQNISDKNDSKNLLCHVNFFFNRYNQLIFSKKKKNEFSITFLNILDRK